MRNATRTICAVSAILLAVAFFTSGASASTESVNQNGLKVEPAISQFQLSSGQHSLTINVRLTNLTSSPMAITFSTKDFGALNQTGSISFYGKNYSPSTNPHSLEKSLSFGTSNIWIPAGESSQVTVHINDVNKLAPGGHFGAALFTPESVTSTALNTNHVVLLPSVASLIFLATASGGTHGIRLLSFGTGNIKASLPATSYLAFKNTGNTQTSPQGQLTLYNPRGNIVATTVLNSSSGMILPGDTRLFTTNLPIKPDVLAMPGLYTLKLQYRDSNSTNFTTINKTFLYINWKMIVLILVALILIIYIVNKFIWKLLKRLVYFRVRRRKLMSIANTQQAKTTPVTSGPKVMDVARPKRPKKT